MYVESILRKNDKIIKDIVNKELDSLLELKEIQKLMEQKLINAFKKSFVNLYTSYSIDNKDSCDYFGSLNLLTDEQQHNAINWYIKNKEDKSLRQHLKDELKRDLDDAFNHFMGN